jgi:hypothetical protein
MEDVVVGGNDTRVREADEVCARLALADIRRDEVQQGGYDACHIRS